MILLLYCTIIIVNIEYQLSYFIGLGYHITIYRFVEMKYHNDNPFKVRHLLLFQELKKFFLIFFYICNKNSLFLRIKYFYCFYRYHYLINDIMTTSSFNSSFQGKLFFGIS